MTGSHSRLGTSDWGVINWGSHSRLYMTPGPTGGGHPRQRIVGETACNADLSLEKAKKVVRQKEAVHEHQQVLREGESKSYPIHLEAVRARPGQRPWERPGHRQRSKQGIGDTKPSQPKKHCTRCGGSPHSRERCPARDVTCHKCRKKGHYAAQCFSRNVSAIRAEQTDQAKQPGAQDEVSEVTEEAFLV